jgi:hypothetical protein
LATLSGGLYSRSALLPILSLPVAVALAFIPMFFLDIPSTIMMSFAKMRSGDRDAGPFRR